MKVCHCPRCQKEVPVIRLGRRDDYFEDRNPWYCCTVCGIWLTKPKGGVRDETDVEESPGDGH